MAKKFFTTSKTGEEVEVSKELAKQLIDAGKKKPNDFTIEEGEIETDFDPNNISFGELPEGDTGDSPVDIQGQQIIESDSGGISKLGLALGPSSSKLASPQQAGRFGGQDLKLTPPTEEGGLPSLSVTGKSANEESFGKGMALISDLFSLPERATGAIFNSDEGRSILEEMADADASLLKQWKQEIREDTSGPSHNPFRRLSGLILEAGGSILVDPTSYFSAAIGLAKGFGKGFAKGTARKTAQDTAESGIPIRQELQDQAQKIVPGGKTPDKIKGIEMTPGEKLQIGGVDSPEIVAREAVLRKTETGEGAISRLAKSRAEGFAPRLELKRTGIDDLLQGSTDLTGKVSKSFDNAFKEFEKETAKGFREVKKIAGKESIDADLGKTARAELNQLLPDEAISSPITARMGLDLTDAEILVLVKKNEFNPGALYDDFGNPVSQKVVDESLKRPVLTSAQLKAKGFTKGTIDSVNDAVDIFGSNPTFQELRNARATIYELEGAFIDGRLRARGKDMQTLVGLRKAYTDAMEQHMVKTGGDDALKLFRATDDEYISKVGINTLKRNFYQPGTNELKTPDKIFESLLKGENVTAKLHELKKALPPESFDELQKAYFNSIFEKSSTGGIMSPEKLINSVDKAKKDIVLWNTLLTSDMKDVLANSIMDAFVLKDLKKFKTPKALESKLSQMLKAGSSSGLSFAISRTFGFGKMAAFRAATFMFKQKLKATEARQAVDFFKGVDPSKFTQGLKQGFRGAVVGAPGIVKAKVKGTLRTLDPRKNVDIKGTEFLKPTPRALVETTIDEEPSLEVTP